MDILGQGVYAGLEGEVLLRGILDGEPQVRKTVEHISSPAVEPGQAGAGLQGEHVRRLPGIREIDGGLQGLFQIHVALGDVGYLVVRGHDAGIQGIARQVDAPGEFMGVGQRPFAVRPEKGLPDIGVQVIGGFRPFMGRNPVGVLVVAGAHLQPSVLRPVLPDKGGVEVAVPESRVSAKGEAVPGVVAIGLQRVVAVEPVGDSHVDVRESGRAAGIVAFLRQPLQDPVGIGGPGTGDDGGFPLHQRAFHVHAARQDADAGGSAPLLHVAVLACHFQDRRHASAVLRRDGTLVQFRLVHDIGIEGGEDAEQVGRVVDGVSVEQDQVLVRAAAADVEAARGLAHALDARKGEDGLDDVPFPEGRRNLVYRLQAHRFHAHLGIPVLGHAFSGNDGFLEHGHLFRHHDIQAAVGKDPDPQGQFFLAVGAEMQVVLSPGQADTVLAAPVGPGVGLRVLVKDDHPVHRLAGLGFRHGAMDPMGVAPPVLAGMADGIDLVPVGGQQGTVLVLDNGGVDLHLGEILVREAVSGAGQIGGSHRSGGRHV